MQNLKQDFEELKKQYKGKELKAVVFWKIAYIKGAMKFYRKVKQIAGESRDKITIRHLDSAREWRDLLKDHLSNKQTSLF